MAQRRNSPLAKCLASVAACFAAVLTVFGQTQAPRPQFREGVDVGHVDVTVLDGKRQVVRGLTAADFTLRLDAKVVPIRAFAAVDVPSQPPALMALAPWTREIAPDVQTNTGSDEGRLVVIFFDRSIPPGPKLEVAKRIARAAVNELGPNDLAAITSVRSHAYQGFTADRARLLRTIDRATPGSAETDDEKVTNAKVFADAPGALEYFRANEACVCNTCVLHQIQQIADELHDVPRPKAFLFIGSQLTLSPQDADVLGNVVGNHVSDACNSPLRDARTALFRSLDRANVAIHTLDPSGLEVGPGVDAASSFGGAAARRQVLENSKLSVAYHNQIRVLPEATGGRVVTNSNAPDTYVPAVLAESASYYVLGFDLPTALSDAAKVEVKVNRGGVKVHVQRAYDPPQPVPTLATTAVTASASPAVWQGASTSSPATLTPAGLAKRAVEGMMPAKGLPMSATAMPLAVRDSDEATVIVVSGLEASSGGGSTRPITADGSRVEFHVIALDPLARFKAESRYAVEMASSDPRHYDVVSRLSLKPGSYEIRSGAAAGDGRSGSVVTYLDVPDFHKEALSLSGLALTTVPPGAGTAVEGADDGLPFVPTARRTFAPTETLRSFVKVYQGGTDPIAPVQLEVRIFDTRGQVMLNAGGPLDPARWDTDRSANIGLDMSLSALAPGDYLLSIAATAAKRTARRDVRFAISSF